MGVLKRRDRHPLEAVYQDPEFRREWDEVVRREFPSDDPYVKALNRRRKTVCLSSMVSVEDETG